MRRGAGKYLLITTMLIVAATLALPYTPLGGLFNFKPVPAYFYLILAAIMVIYVSSAELAKKLFYRWVDY